MKIQRSPYVTYAGVRKPQPVPFSHQHHVTGLGIDCRYCHTSVETSSFAGIPPTKTCMNCHSQIWTNAKLLEPVRASYRSGDSLQWTRVNQLPDFVYFNHSIHINKGVGCNTCHGPVDQMPLMYQQESSADGVVPGLPSRAAEIICGRATRSSTCATSSRRRREPGGSRRPELHRSGRRWARAGRRNTKCAACRTSPAAAPVTDKYCGQCL